MALSSIFIKLGKGFSWLLAKVFSWEFLFGAGLTLGTKVFRFYGMFAFAMTLFLAIQTGFAMGTNLLEILGYTILEIIKTIIGVDQYIYNLSVTFNNIASPTLYQAITTTLLILQKSFFYIWWFRTIKYFTRQYGLFKTDASTPPSILDWKVFKALYIGIILANISYIVFIDKSIIFNYNSLQGVKGLELISTMFGNGFIFFDNLIAKNWFHWFIAFKGIGHYLFLGGLYKTIVLLSGSQIATKVTEQIGNLTGNNT